MVAMVAMVEAEMVEAEMVAMVATTAALIQTETLPCFRRPVRMC